MKKTTIIILLFFFVGSYLSGQNYNNIVNYSLNDTPTHGIKIKTNLPFLGNVQCPLITIEGYNYSYGGTNASTLKLDLGYVIGGSLNVIGQTVSSNGGTAPPVWLGNENGKVVIFIDQRIYYARFSVSAFAHGYKEKPEYFEGWTVVDEPFSGSHEVLIPYKNTFGKVGIGTENPQAALDVAGMAYTQNLLIKESAVIGSRTSPEFGNIDRLTIVPHTHTGGPWIFTSRDILGSAFLDITYGTRHLIAINHNNRIGILTQNPTCALDVNGTIRAKEVKIEATGWADFVFGKDYNLPSLSEVEMYINEHGTLPDIPSEKEVVEKGIDVGEMQAKLLQKIEELTLYVIELKKENEAQDKLIQELQNR